MERASHEMSIIEAIRDGLIYEMERDERVIILGMDVGTLGGVFRVTKGLLEQFTRLPGRRWNARSTVAARP